MEEHKLSDLNKYLSTEDLSVVGYILNKFKYDSFYIGYEAKDFKTEKPFPGIYILVKQKAITYIGTAKNIMKRLYNQKKINGHDIIVIDTTGRRNRLRLETALVSMIDPGENKIKSIYGNRY